MSIVSPNPVLTFLLRIRGFVLFFLFFLCFILRRGTIFFRAICTFLRVRTDFQRRRRTLLRDSAWAVDWTRHRDPEGPDLKTLAGNRVFSDEYRRVCVTFEGFTFFPFKNQDTPSTLILYNNNIVVSYFHLFFNVYLPPAC